MLDIAEGMPILKTIVIQTDITTIAPAMPSQPDAFNPLNRAIPDRRNRLKA